MKTPDAHLGIAIDAACYYRGVDTATLAATMDVSVETVRRWRRGDNRMSLATAARLAQVLGMPCDLLLSPPASRERALALLAAHDGAREAR